MLSVEYDFSVGRQLNITETNYPSAQRFYIYDRGNGNYSISPVDANDPNKVIGLSGTGPYTNDRYLQMSTYSGVAEQWTLTAVNSSFTPRTTAPLITDFHYYSTQNPFVAAGYGLPNCTTYAWGRAWEITGSQLPSGFLGNAKTWWNATTLPKGSTPQLGAICVWVGGDYGHVAIVEAINGNLITISESNYDGLVFHTRTITPVVNSDFAGYIYIR